MYTAARATLKGGATVETFLTEAAVGSRIIPGF